MTNPRRSGFTLIELLTVIAIIAILVGITASVLPGVLERAKITRTQADMRQIHTAMIAYVADHSSLPPGYGYRWNRDIDAATFAGNPKFVWNIEPYMAKIKLFRVFGVYDENWSTNYDVNRNKNIDILEFNPLGTENASGNYTFTNALYPDAATLPEAARMMQETPPFVYIPVTKAHAQRFRQFCQVDPNDTDRLYARGAAVAGLAGSFEPPRTYDTYVLVSPGPGGSVSGVIPGDVIVAGNDGEDTYYFNALRAYYLATRDLNRNGKLDFDFIARSREGESDFRLPDGTNGYGPLIYVSE